MTPIQTPPKSTILPASPAPVSTTNAVATIPPGSIPIPAAYASLGVVTGYNPQTADKLRLFIVALSGRGKTTFVSSDRNSIILDFEDGANAIPRGVAARISILNYDVYRKVVDRLIDDGVKNKRIYGRIVIDTVEALIELIGSKFAGEEKIEHFSEYGAKGAGYAVVRHRLWSDIVALEGAGYTWTIVGHLTEKTVVVNRQEMTIVRPVVSASFNSIIFRNSDIFAQVARVITVKKKKVQRVVNGQTIEIALEGQDELTTNYFLQAASIPGESVLDQAKARGVPSLAVNIPINTNGWSSFVSNYNEAVLVQKHKLGCA